MVKRILALLALALAVPVSAQTVQDGFVVPPDVPLFVEQPVVYAAGSTKATVGDGSDARGGTMPVLANALTDIPTDPSVKDTWIAGSPNYVTVTDPAAEETKARFGADFCHANKDDPIRNYGDVGGAHWHVYVGSCSVNAHSTYASLRNRANDFSTASTPKSATAFAGGPNNATGYWFPAVIKPNAFGDGKDYILPPTAAIVYYEANPATKAAFLQPLYRGLRYVLGTNMDDPYDTAFKAEIAAANAQTGTAGRYVYPGNGFVGWQCWTDDVTGTSVPATVEALPDGSSPAFQTSTGGDPWDGACTTGMYLMARIQAPECHDGVNMWAPGGYKNFRQRVIDTVRNDPDEGCPENWFFEPRLDETVWYKHQGWTDYSQWILSSDAMATMAAQAIDPEAPAMLPGQSMHADWLGAWDGEIFNTWQDQAFGVFGNTTLQRLNDSTIDTTRRLITGTTPDGTRGGTQIHSGTDPWYTDSPANMIEIPASVGPVTVDIHTHE